MARLAIAICRQRALGRVRRPGGVGYPGTPRPGARYLVRPEL